MPPNLTGAGRRKVAQQAYDLSIRRATYTQIAESLKITRQLASNLVSEEQARRTEETSDERDRAIATYDAIIRSGWQRLATTKDNSLNVSGLLNSIRAAQAEIDKITGVRAPEKLQVALERELDSLIELLESGLEPNEFRKVAGVIASRYALEAS